LIVYADSSALVKRYVSEKGSKEVFRLIEKSTALGTAIISKTEVAAALGKAVRMKYLKKDQANSALKAFMSDWDSLIRLQLSEILVDRAATLAWDLGLRGYDAMHLAAAQFWQEILGEAVTVATYDRELWSAAVETGLKVWPAE
jgi:predicted nucleic acid-binding protein